jgi:hypothetical protein
MFGDICTTCHCTAEACTCSEPQPRIPGPDGAECAQWISLNDVKWTGDPIAGTPIKRGMGGTEIALWLIQEINELESRITTLETP